ncbi:MAG: exodeoxyribonuclease VII large subunit [Anaerolineae bacterium]|nr:exodeoxyribonuclease VII large subunit [Anaerolineae bacterium]
MTEQDALSVSELTEIVKATLEGEAALYNVRVRGEIGQLSRPSSGHLYFTLKDAQAQVRCVMWRAQARLLRFTPQTGQAVIARGNIGVYERDGLYQLYVSALAVQGEGELFSALELLKQRLAAEGLFDAARKRPLPEFPRIVGVVTSPTGAALQDILNILRRRYPVLTVILSPTLVQGEDAPLHIVRAIQRLNRLPADERPDVLLVVRGGGSPEELAAFNDESVVRAVAGSAIPVVSGVGHEIDLTLTDLAADVRAPTPSAAAELISPDAAELRQTIDALSERARQLATKRLREARAQLDAAGRALRLLNPAQRLAQQRAHLSNLGRRLDASALRQLESARLRLGALRAQLNALSPLATLARGYAIVRARDGRIVRSISAVHSGDDVVIQVSDGQFEAQVLPARRA